LSAVVLCPEGSHAAGNLGDATLVVISADPDQLDGDGVPDCSTINSCTYPARDGTFAPAIRFIIGGPGSVDVSADIWGTAFDCSSDPDATVGMTYRDLPSGRFTAYIIFDPPAVAGDTFAITWNVAGCPAVFCAFHWTPYTIDEADPPSCASSGPSS
jgi:hypothetical protein